MPRINVYEHSSTYSWQTYDKSFACLAFPITAIWGPAYDDTDEDSNPDWVRFEAGYRGSTDFVTAFRGANTTLGNREHSYDYALKLLGSGYDILVKRADGLGKAAKATLALAGGSAATFTAENRSGGEIPEGYTNVQTTYTGTSKVLGTVGNNLVIKLVRNSPVIKDIASNFAGRVRATIYVYQNPEGIGSSNLTYAELLETFTVSYDQAAATVADKSITFATDTLVEGTNFKSDYIQQLTVQGLGNYTNLQYGFSGATSATDYLTFIAKYKGTYGNNLKLRLKVGQDVNGRKIGVVEVFDRNWYTDNDFEIVRTDQLLESVAVAFDEAAATDDRPLYTEATYNYLKYILPATATSANLLTVGSTYILSLHGATDSAIAIGSGEGVIPSDTSIPAQIQAILAERFGEQSCTFTRYITDLVGTAANPSGTASTERVVQIWNQQRVLQNAIAMVDELTDPLVYDWDAVFLATMDDQYVPISWFDQQPAETWEFAVTTAHTKLFEVASLSKCGAAMVGTPFNMKRGTWEPYTRTATGAVQFKNELSAALGQTLSTFGELVGPWAHASLPLAGSNAWICPEVAHLLLIINADGIGGCQRWWLPPAGMLGNGAVYSPEYKIKKGYLDIIQNHDEGVCLNPIMNVPGKGVTCFGNSTLWDKPLGSYNALQNLSTRLLCNRVKQRVWDSALLILFKYNNEDAYSHFYANLTPLLDEMKNLGALNATEANPLGYKVIMNPDIINLDRINANTVIGKVELAVTGVIDTVDVDIFLLPPNAFDTV